MWRVLHGIGEFGGAEQSGAEQSGAEGVAGGVVTCTFSAYAGALIERERVDILLE